jgi:diguanylate cyclase (GGDEF)-like protein
MRRDNDLLLSNLREREEFGRIASVDGLTGLHNRRWMEFIYPRQLLRCRRTSLPASLILADIDRFSDFNARHTYLRGDRALQRIGAVLGQRVRPNDLLARYDNDDFVLLLPGASLPQAAMVAERLCHTIAATPVFIGEPGDKEEYLTVSVGVVELGEGGDLDEMMAAAHRAVGAAVAAGGNRVHALRS